MLPTIAWEGDEIVMVDQRKLPAREVYVRCRTARAVAKAVQKMVIRGAPAIGVAAAMGVALAEHIRRNEGPQTPAQALDDWSSLLTHERLLFDVFGSRFHFHPNHNGKMGSVIIRPSFNGLKAS